MQAAEMAMLKEKFNQILDESNPLKEMFDTDLLVIVLSKSVSNLNVKKGTTITRAHYIRAVVIIMGGYSSPSWHMVLMGLNLAVTCNYYKDKGQMKENCVYLNRKIAHDMQKQENVVAMTATACKNIIKTHMPKRHI